MIADSSSCIGYWYRGTYKENCDFDSDSIGIGPISIVLGFIIILILIFKKKNSNNFSRISSKLLEEYVVWYQNNKDNSASIGNIYTKGDFLIVKDKIGTILDEVTKDTARIRCSQQNILKEYQDEVNYEEYKRKNVKRNWTEEEIKDIDYSMDMIGLNDYIKFHNKNNDRKADLSNSGVLGGVYVLNDAKGNLIKEVDLFDAETEISNDQNT